MKQYKLLKDIPGVKAGAISLNRGNGYHEFKGYDLKGLPHDYVYAEVFMDRFPDFFEEVIELEKVFTIQDLYKIININAVTPKELSIIKVESFIQTNHPQHIDQLKYIK